MTPRLHGRRTARLTREALSLARSRRARGNEPVMRPFALVAREEGFTELFALGSGPLLESLGRELGRACASADTEGVLVFEAVLDGRDVLVLDMFLSGVEEPSRQVVPVDEA